LGEKKVEEDNNKKFPDNYPIRAYRGKDLSEMKKIYIADTRLTVEMPFVEMMHRMRIRKAGLGIANITERNL